MIPLTRTRTAAAILAEFRGTRRVAKERDLLRGRRDGTLKLETKLWTKAKARLRAESARKCAYCESPTSVVAHGDVEHFRPKGVYWWLACCYDNYLFACQICNQSYKGDDFPVYGSRLPEPAVAGLTDARLDALAGTLGPDPLDDDPRCARAEFERLTEREQPGLLNPYLVDPEPLFAWEADENLKEVRLRPRTQATVAKRAVADSERFLGLNREELQQERFRIYGELATFVEVLGSGQLSAVLRGRIEEAIRAMMADDHPYAGMTRYFVRTEWRLDL